MNLRVTMVLENLDSIPTFDLPAPYAIRPYQADDETAWTQIHIHSDDLNPITPELFSQQFGSDPGLLRARQLYLVNEPGLPIGTGTAWFNPDFQGRNFGRVHWLAIVPEYQGRGLGKALLSLICRRLVELGHEEAYLTTSFQRIKAIRLYLNFGFKPLISSSQEQEAWNELRDRIGR